MTVDELRECPACGGSGAELYRDYEDDDGRMWQAWVMCPACAQCGVACMGDSDDEMEAAATAAWNALPRKGDAAALAAQVAELQAELAAAYDIQKQVSAVHREILSELAALKAAGRWQPVEDGYTYTDKRDHTLSVYPRCLDIADEASGLSVQLPEGVRLCRWVDAANDAATAAADTSVGNWLKTLRETLAHKDGAQ